MTVPLSDTQPAAITAGREAVRVKLAGLFSGQLGIAFADEVADAAMAPLLAEVERLRAELAQAREPIIARWSDSVIHHDGGTTVQCVDADDPLRGIALELDMDDREALGLMLVDPDGEMDQADDEDDHDPYEGHFRYCYVRDGDGSLCSCGHATAVARQAADTTSKEA
jgi:hypothetical protein